MYKDNDYTREELADNSVQAVMDAYYKAEHELKQNYRRIAGDMAGTLTKAGRALSPKMQQRLNHFLGKI